MHVYNSTVYEQNNLVQVLAASKNKISTLKGFPYLPVLEVSRKLFFIWSNHLSERSDSYHFYLVDFVWDIVHHGSL